MIDHPTPAPRPPRVPARDVANGTYTLTNPASGGYRTYRVQTWERDVGGSVELSRVLQLLVGSDNEGDFVGFAFLTDRGPSVWRRFQSANDKNQWGRLAWWFWKTVAEGEGPLQAQLSKRCLRCNRKLTTPESLERGVGPECWEAMGGA